MTIKFDNLGVYARNDDAESKTGVDVEFPNGITVTILRAGGSNHKYTKAVRTYLTPAILRKIDAGVLSQDDEDALWAEIYADGIVIDFKGLKANGKDVPFSRDVVVDLLIASPQMLKDLKETADKLMTFRQAENEEEAENLGNSSSGTSSGGSLKKG